MDLKNFYDRVITAQAAIETVKNQIADALALGTPEGEEQALALEATLDTAIADEAKWHAFYNKLVDSSKGQNALGKFIPLTSQEIEEEPKDEKKTMKRVDWNALDPVARGQFITAGGKLED